MLKLSEYERDFVLNALVSEIKDRVYMGSVDDEDVQTALKICQRLDLCSKDEFLMFLQEGAVTLDDARELLREGVKPR